MDEAERNLPAPAAKRPSRKRRSVSYAKKKNPATPSSDEVALLDVLLKGFGISNDAQLAAWLGIDKSLIYATRAGKRRLGRKTAAGHRSALENFGPYGLPERTIDH